jgi:pimeloyl-ACP methyl ester carboxylesterase
MGGKAAMALALTRPEAIRRLVVVDIAPVAYGHSQMEFLDAMRRADLSGIERRSDVDLGLGDPGVSAFLLQSLDVANRRWRLNLDALAASMDETTGWPDIDGAFPRPALFLRGGASDYVADVHLPRIRDLFPEAEVQTIEGAGHWLHAERPREAEAAIRRFLSAPGNA